MEHANPEEAILALARRDFDRWAAGDTAGYGQSAADDVTYSHNVAAHARVDGIQAFRQVTFTKSDSGAVTGMVLHQW